MASQGRELANHFQNVGTPVMIGKVFWTCWVLLAEWRISKSYLYNGLVLHKC